MLVLDLQRFADGGGAGAGSGGNAGAGGAPSATATAAPSGERPADAALEMKTRTGRKFTVDMRAQAQEPASSPTRESPSKGQTPPAGTRPSFEELIEGEYKADFGKRVSSIVQDRLKNAKAAEEKLTKLTPAIEALLKKNGLEEGDLDGLVRKITDDDSLYEDEALEKGIPVSTLKQMKQLEAEKSNLQRIQAERMQQEALQKHFQTLVEQGERVKQMYPGFDLRQEMQNPQFVELTRPGVNVDVMTAYRVIHNDEIVGGAMQVSAQKTAEKLSNAMRSGAMRPAENGLSPTSRTVDLKDDPKTWSKERYNRAIEIVKRGGNPYTA